MRYFWIIALFLSSNIVEGWIISKGNNKMAECLQKMLQNENIKFDRNIRISVETKSDISNWNFGDIINLLIAPNQIFNLTVELQAYSTENPAYDIHTRILFIDSFVSYKYLITMQRLHSQEKSGTDQYYYVILPNVINTSDSIDIIKQIIDFSFKNNIININILIEDTKGTITIYTYYPFNKNNCKDTTPIVYNHYINGEFKKIAPSFPQKLQNFWKCPLVAVLWDKPPFVYFDNDQVLGSDAYFIKTLAHRMNFTLEIKISPKGLGHLLPNGTMTGAFKIVQDGEADLMIGGLVCSKLRKDNLASTRDYFSTSLQVIVKRPKAYSSLEVLVFPFDVSTWGVILMVLTGKWMGAALLQKIGILYGPNNFGANSKRIQLLTWLLSIFVLRSCYEGSIFKFIHKYPRRSIPKDIDEANAEGYKFLIKSSFFPIVKQVPELSGKLILVDVLLSKLIDEFDKYEGKYGLITIGELLIIFKDDSTKFGRYVMIKNPILHNILCIYMPKFSFLTDHFNKQIKMMINHGHMEDIYAKSVLNDLKRMSYYTTKNEYNAMSIYHLSGAFQLLIALISFSTWIFFMEIFSTHNRFVKRFIDFLNQ